MHRYDWGYADRVAGSLARHGVRWLPIISYSALWAASLPDNDKAPPFTPDDYAAYAGAFAERYGRDGRFWAEHPDLPATPATAIEIWNEPDNSDFWAPRRTRRLHRPLPAARTAIRAADPRARVLIGGLTGAPTFLPQLLAARPDARGQIDGVAVHTYSPEPLGALAETSATRGARSSRSAWPTCRCGSPSSWVRGRATRTSTRRRRAAHIEGTTSALVRLDCGVEGVVLYAGSPRGATRGRG